MVEKSKGVLRSSTKSGEWVPEWDAFELGSKICDAIHTPHMWSSRRVESIKAHCGNKKTR